MGYKSYLVLFVFFLVSHSNYSQAIDISEFDRSDVSNAFHLAMKSEKDTLILTKKGSPYFLKPMRFNGCKDKTIIFEKGVEIRAMVGAFPKTNDALLKFLSCKNITIVGNESILSMNKPEYVKGEWRHVIRIMGSSNITIKNLTLQNSGGDGVTIGGDQRNLYSENIVIDKIKSLNNKRQGISIVSAKNVLVSNSLFAETIGTLPGAGVDIEPDKPKDIIQNIVFNNCVFRDNYNSGIKVALVKLDSTSNPVSILFKNCLLKNNFCVEDVKVPTEIMVKSNKLSPVKGKVTFENCHVEDSQWGFLFAKINAKGFTVNFKGCSAKNICQSGKRPAIYLETTHFKESNELGGIDFDSLYLDYKTDVPVISVLGSRRGAMKRLVNVKGKFILTSKKSSAIDYNAYDQNNNKGVELELIYQ